jgi:parallel beta-helix repeat protein
MRLKRLKVVVVIIISLLSMQVIARTIDIPDEYDLIQAGIEGACPGDTVLVGPGIYFENIILTPGVTLLGAGVDSSIIDGSNEGDVIIGADQSLISGFTIRNSGELYCAIRCQGSSPSISKNLVIRNGRGIVCLEGVQPIIEFNIITRCDDGSDFGTVAISCKHSSPIIRNNTISNNYAHYAVLCDSAFPLIKNNIISHNWGGIACLNGSVPTLLYNDVWNNPSFGDYYGCEPDEGSISQDPLFIDPEEDNYQLSSNSPCIGAGDPTDQSPVRPRVDIGALEYQDP